jgi:RHS repeat-associated protein
LLSPLQPSWRIRHRGGSGEGLSRGGNSGSAWTTTAAYDIAGIIHDTDGNLKNLQRYRDNGTLIDNLTYSYPGSSNRLSSVTDAVATTPETWDAETGSFTYDANGNVKTAPAPYSITNVTYDPANLPLSITRTGTTTTYRYDDAGQRITKQVGTGNTEFYLREGGTTVGVFTLNGSGALVSWYSNLLWEARMVGRQPNTGNRDYYHFDILGSTRAVVQGASSVESHDYDPWGLELPGRGLGSGTKEAFSGKEQDVESGLDYFGARYYMPALGRWTAVDPEGGATPQWSPYNYVNDNPVGDIDPDGRQPWLRRLANIAAGFGDRVSLGLTAWVRDKWDANDVINENSVAYQLGGLSADATLTAIATGIVDPGEAPLVEEGTSPKALVGRNAAQGRAFEQRVVSQLEAEGQEGVVEQVTVKTESGVRTRVDAVGRDRQTGQLRLTEGKSSETARLTPAQRQAHPEISRTGATVVGKGKPGVPGGTRIPPQEVRVLRPSDITRVEPNDHQ